MLAGSKFRLGGMIAPPPRFNPTVQLADRLYLYRIDTERNICKVTILNDRATRPAGYYTLTDGQAPRPEQNPDQVSLIAEEPAIPAVANKPRREIEIKLPRLQLPHVQLPSLPKIKVTRPAKLPKPLKLPKQAKPQRSIKFKHHFNVRKPVIALASTVGTAALLLVIYPLYPQIQYQVAQTVAPLQYTNTALADTPISAGNELRIPKIGIRTAILESPTLDILNKKEGVWHQTGTLGSDNFVLAGHRWKYLPPNSSTLYLLDKLQVGDTVVVDWFQKRYIYTVKEIQTVSQDRTDLIQPTSKSRLTIYTCNDKKETERIVVIAEPEK